MTLLSVPADLQRVEPAYRSSLRVRTGLRWLVLVGISLLVDRLLLAEWPVAWGLPVIVGLLALAAVIVVPNRIYRRLGYALDGQLLRIVRGWLFHIDTVVPFVRVQHIDVSRGPIEKIFGLASLIVHTAGTHNSTVTLPGLSPDKAASIRDAIRAEIRADEQ